MSSAACSHQGTNAHAVMGLATLGDDSMGQAPATPWQRQRIWYEPPPHQLLLSAAVYHAPGRAVVFSTPLARGALAFLRDHRVRGRILLPGAAMFEMSSAAASVAATVGCMH